MRISTTVKIRTTIATTTGLRAVIEMVTAMAAAPAVLTLAEPNVLPPPAQTMTPTRLEAAMGAEPAMLLR